MAEIRNVELVPAVYAPGSSATVKVDIRFSAREVTENFKYGVNVAVVRHNPQHYIIHKHKGRTGMDLQIIPLDAPRDFQVAAGEALIEPSGLSDVTVTVVCNYHRSFVNGTALQAYVTVVPEIAESSAMSAPVAAP